MEIPTYMDDFMPPNHTDFARKKTRPSDAQTTHQNHIFHHKKQNGVAKNPHFADFHRRIDVPQPDQSQAGKRAVK